MTSTTPTPPPAPVRVHHGEPAFLRAHALLAEMPTDLLTSSAKAELAWCRLELCDGSLHMPTEWQPAELAGGVTGLEVLAELEANITQLITDSTDLATTLRYHRARSYARNAVAAVQNLDQSAAGGES